MHIVRCSASATPCSQCAIERDTRLPLVIDALATPKARLRQIVIYAWDNDRTQLHLKDSPIEEASVGSSGF